MNNTDVTNNNINKSSTPVNSSAPANKSDMRITSNNPSAAPANNTDLRAVSPDGTVGAKPRVRINLNATASTFINDDYRLFDGSDSDLSLPPAINELIDFFDADNRQSTGFLTKGRIDDNFDG